MIFPWKNWRFAKNTKKFFLNIQQKWNHNYPWKPRNKMLLHQHARFNMLNRVTDCKKINEKRKSQKFNQKYFLKIYLEKYTQKGKLATQISSEEPRNENKWMLSPTLPPQKIARTHTHTHSKRNLFFPLAFPFFFKTTKHPQAENHTRYHHAHTHPRTPTCPRPTI